MHASGTSREWMRQTRRALLVYCQWTIRKFYPPLSRPAPSTLENYLSIVIVAGLCYAVCLRYQRWPCLGLLDVKPYVNTQEGYQSW